LNATSAVGNQHQRHNDKKELHRFKYTGGNNEDKISCRHSIHKRSRESIFQAAHQRKYSQE